MSGSHDHPTRPPADPYDPLRIAAARFGDAAAIVMRGQTLSWSTLDRSVDRSAALLRERGVGPRDIVATRLSNGIDHILVLLGLLRIGAIAAPVSLRLPASGVSHALDTLGTDALVTADNGFFDTTRILTTISNERTADRSAPHAGPRRRATAVFTSGTSGKPKAVVHRLSAHLASARGANTHLGFGVGDRWLLSLPLYHVGGLAILFRALSSGGAIVLPEDDVPMAEMLRRAGATHVSLVQTQVVRLIEEGPGPLLRSVLTGGGPLGEDLLNEASRRGWPVVASWGMTETASLVTCTRPGMSEGELGTAGRALDGRRIRLGAGGEILVSGPVLFTGTFEAGRFTSRQKGAFHTGDLGRMDDRGRLVLVGRTDNRFVSGGENIQPERIERAIMAIPGVIETMVVPVDDPVFGRIPFAFVSGGPGPATVRKALEAVLPRFMIPKLIAPFPEDTPGPGIKKSRAGMTRAAERSTAGSGR